MQYEAVFSGIWQEVFGDNVEMLSVYRRQRATDFPGVPVRQFSDWRTHREWMCRTRDKYLRMANNHRILDEIAQEEAQENDEKKGS